VPEVDSLQLKPLEDCALVVQANPRRGIGETVAPMPGTDLDASIVMALVALYGLVKDRHAKCECSIDIEWRVLLMRARAELRATEETGKPPPPLTYDEWRKQGGP